MAIGTWIKQYLVAAVVFSLIDLVWLGLVANELYERLLDDLLADEPNGLAALLFYALFVAGLVYFVIRPSISERSLGKAVFAGAFFGLVTYATWDLTSLAVIEGFPVQVVPIDMAWGAVLAASVSAATYGLWFFFAQSGGNRLRRERPGRPDGPRR